MGFQEKHNQESCKENRCELLAILMDFFSTFSLESRYNLQLRNTPEIFSNELHGSCGHLKKSQTLTNS
ncbi:CLUMA_CG010373, isoform A [Clunio marinus]|uniref:CLUMA_CG010373, isoform A n=1 Tax=Clunio marinus TaxID=568069 RepID=A0A1J1I9L3_9DIPT|nr:CLUMA_CG010373, isoform A [Clunio marinus]